MDLIVPISEARSNLPGLIKKIAHAGKHLIITKNGRAAAVLLTPEELETLEVKADRKLMQAIQRGLGNLKAGRLYSHEDVFKDV